VFRKDDFASAEKVPEKQRAVMDVSKKWLPGILPKLYKRWTASVV
jgi:hypothetical protein